MVAAFYANLKNKGRDANFNLYGTWGKRRGKNIIII